MATDHRVLQIGPDDQGKLVSSDEFASADFQEPWRYERADGRLVVVAPAGEDHIDMSEPWRDWLVAYKLQHPDVVYRVVSVPWVRVDEGTDRIGDIGVYLVTEAPAPRIPDRVPDLMFEFVSPGRESHERDYVRKRKDYFKFGVREYVIIDRAAGIVTVHTRGARSYRTHVLKSNDEYTSDLLPGFVLRLSDVL